MAKDDISIAKTFGIFDLVIAFPFAVYAGFFSGHAFGNDQYPFYLAGLLFVVRGILTLMRWRIAWLLHLLFSWLTAIVFSTLLVLFTQFNAGDEGNALKTMIIAVTAIIIVLFLMPYVRKEFNASFRKR